MYDLSQDPQSWLNLDVEEIQARIFTPNAEMPEGVERVALKTIHINKCPALAPLSVLTDEVIKRYEINIEMNTKHQAVLNNSSGLTRKVATVFADAFKKSAGFDEGENDPDLMLYSGGFFDGNDKSCMTEIRGMKPELLAEFTPYFHDPRLNEMLFRYRGRNYPETLSEEEKHDWDNYCRDCLTNPNAVPALQIDTMLKKLDELEVSAPVDKKALISEIRAYAKSLCQQLAITL